MSMKFAQGSRLAWPWRPRDINSKFRQFKIANGRHIANCKIAISQRQKIPNFDEIWYTNAGLELGDSQMTKYENF